MADIKHIRETVSGAMNHSEREQINEAITKVNQLYPAPHAALYFEDKSETLTMTQNTWTHITNATNDLFTAGQVVGLSVSDDTLVVATAGDYMIACSLSFSGTTNGDVYEFAFFKNNTIASPKMERTTTSSDIGNVGLPYYTGALAVDDVLDLRIRNTANNFNATVIACSWVTWLLHY
jgi:hypothetical protein